MVYKRRDGELTKRCRVCNKTKTADNFYAANTKTGFSNRCISCEGDSSASLHKQIESLEKRLEARTSALVKHILDCPLCLRKGYVFTPPNIVRTCICHMSMLVKIAGMQGEVFTNASVEGQEENPDHNGIEGDGYD